MKHTFKILLLSVFLLAVPLLMLAQDVPPLPGQTDPASGTEVGAPAGAPVGNGTFILLTLAAAYAVRRRYAFSPEKEEGPE